MGAHKWHEPCSKSLKKIDQNIFLPKLCLDAKERIRRRGRAGVEDVEDHVISLMQAPLILLKLQKISSDSDFGFLFVVQKERSQRSQEEIAHFGACEFLVKQTSFCGNVRYDKVVNVPYQG